MSTVMWVRYAPSVMLVDCLGMTADVELAHRRLCDWVWAHGECPLDRSALLQGITRVPAAEWVRVSKVLRTKGWRRVAGRLTHDWAVAVLREAEAAHASAVARGMKGGRSKLSLSPAQAQPKPSPTSAPARLQPSLSSGASSAQAEPKHTDKQIKKQIKRQIKKERDIESCLTDEQLICSAAMDGNGKETEFMSELRATLERFDEKKAHVELETWGGWWRNRFRENADKARRVLAELRSMVAEGRVKRNAGAAGKDLWGRFA